MGANDFPVQEVKGYDAAVEVVAASDDRIDKLQVTYSNVKGGELRAASPYLIEAGSSGPRVTAADGRELQTAEVKAVMEANGELVRRTPGRSWLIGRTFKKGKAVKLGDAAIADLFGVDAQYEVEAMTARLVSVGKQVARFRFEGTFRMRDNDADVDGQLAGTASGSFEVDVKRGLIVAAEVSMTMSGTLTSGGQTFTVTGTAVGEKTWAYQDP
jgi:hypothetical protein